MCEREEAKTVCNTNASRKTGWKKRGEDVLEVAPAPFPFVPLTRIKKQEEIVTKTIA